ncbi:MAG: GEVED domain-containing protein [Bacteroidales bacterium]
MKKNILFFIVCLWVSFTVSAQQMVMNSPQSPDLGPTGLAVRATDPFLVADDWLCNTTGTIDQIVIWGGWLYDQYSPVTLFTLRIYSDVPASGQIPSHPGSLLWEYVAVPGSYPEPIPTSLANGEGFFNPELGSYIFPADMTIWYYSFPLPTGTSFDVTSGTVYWLMVTAMPISEPNAQFGWKVSLDHWNDKAVWKYQYDNTWLPMVYPPQHPFFGNNIDMAFIIYGTAGYQACCLPDGSCMDLPFNQCLQMGGMPMGDGTTCAVVSCPLPPEACCWPDGTCSMLPPGICAGEGGTPQGFGSLCENNPCETEEREYGDAPEGALAYPGSGVIGSFPTCKNVGPALFIEHNNFGAYFGPTFDFESDGNAGLCPAFNPNQYDQDECWQGPDAGLIIPGSFTITGPIGSEIVSSCPNTSAVALGNTCSPVVWGQNIDIDVTNQMPSQAVGYVNLLIDWNQDGIWSGSSVCQQGDVTVNVNEHVLVNFPVPNGYVGPLSGLFTLTPPPGFVISFILGPNAGYVWARFSITEAPVTVNWDGSGVFEDGETEDYLFLINQASQYDLDFGDAPDPYYPTLAVNNGAVHQIIQGFTLGPLIDAETDGQPHTLAQGDDMNNLDDEDGVMINFGMLAGSPTNITVNASAAGKLDAFTDYNADGDWYDAGEQIFNSYPLQAGNNILTYIVPANVVSSPSFSRFRLSLAGGLNSTGFAMSGEVEDYQAEYFPTQGFKWIQSPDPTLPGIHVHDGVVGGTYQRIVGADDWLCQGGVVTDIHWHGVYENQGSGINFFHLSIHADDPTVCMPSDPELWGMDIPLANVNETPSGVLNAQGQMIYNYVFYLPTPFMQVQGTRYWLDITAVSVNNQLPARWLWCEAARSHLPALCTAVTKTVIAGTPSQWQPIDWAVGTQTDLAFEITSMEVVPQNDFGDAPDVPYPTLAASNGAQHVIMPGFFLGNSVDGENNGQPSGLADGDDLNNNDDEDGVFINWGGITGSPVNLRVVASLPGFLDAWADFNNDGDWADAGEQIFTVTPLISGSNYLSFVVPAGADTNGLYCRYRYSQQGGLTYMGLAPDGEVEDYKADITQDTTIKWGQPVNNNHPGLHAHDAIVLQNNVSIYLADDWLCSGGDVTQIVWYGVYESPGSGINHFNLRILPDVTGACLPGLTSIIDVDIALSSLAETFTGSYTNDGNAVYKYTWNLTTPFAQVAGTRYWLALSAFSNNIQVPAVWRWCEAARSHVTALCSTAQLTITNGLPSLWTQLPSFNGRYSEMAFEIVSALIIPSDFFIRVGPWVIAEPWHNWFGGANDTTSVQLYAKDPDKMITQVIFSYSIIPGTWNIFATDNDGSNTRSGLGGTDEIGDGWTGYLPNLELPQVLEPVFFKVEITLNTGEILEYVRTEPITYDPTPPSSITINVTDFQTLETSTLNWDVNPMMSNLQLVEAWVDPKPKIFNKGIPHASQLNENFENGGENYCAPTAAAACLAYFEQQHPGIMGGYDITDLTMVLANKFNTDPDNGTYTADVVDGLRRWINQQGGGFTVRSYGNWQKDANNQWKSSFNMLDWMTMRNELERCQDVLAQWCWVGPNGVLDKGHFTTFNSIHNDFSINVSADFMDPYTGDEELGSLNTNTGLITDYADGSEDDPDYADLSAQLGEYVIVCPAEGVSHPAVGKIKWGDDPMPDTFQLRLPGLYWLRLIAVDHDGHSYRMDYVVNRLSVDYGDAPDSYQTLFASDGARHQIDSITYLGDLIDSDPDGQPCPSALCDDENDLDDEDGILFPWPLKKGNPAVIIANASVSGGFLNVWIDYNKDGDWNEPNEHVFTDKVLHSGNNTLGFVIPPEALIGETFARFRFSTIQGLSYFGPAPDGEVEDYQVMIETSPSGIKWEQYFDPQYSGYHAHDYLDNSFLREENYADDWICPGGLVTDIHWWGNYEVNNEVELRGSGIDYFAINIYSELAGCMVGSDPLAAYVVPLANLNETATGIISPEGSMVYEYTYYLTEPFEQMQGEKYWISITAHAVAPSNPALWRWNESIRTEVPFLCTSKTRSVVAGVPEPWYDVYAGEVYPLNMAFALTNVEQEPIEFGDAPDSYATLLASNGARHGNINPNIFMGVLRDLELNGQPSITAMGDDLNTLDDEDGVTFNTPLIQGQPATISIVSSMQGALLDGWIDFNGDGDFLDPGEQVIINFNSGLGPNIFNILVPADASLDSTYARFRISTVPNLPPFGFAPIGEVEDYVIDIEAPAPELDYGDAPEGSLAYPASGVMGAFPTCVGVNIASFISHNNFGAYFGPLVDFENEGNAGLCPLFNPNQYNQDECWLDNDAGLIIPGAYTIAGPVGSEMVVACPQSSPGPLGSTCTPVLWGQNIDINVTNQMPNQSIGYVNLLIDWNQDGQWGGSSVCNQTDITINVPEHVLVNFPIPSGYVGPLSALMPVNPPAFFWAGPNPGYVWGRFSVTEAPVAANWEGSGIFEDGETEDYLFLISQSTQPGIDWGDAPDPAYPTLAVSDGARHLILQGYKLGNLLDGEIDGQPHTLAQGDDMAGMDDEDGVTNNWGSVTGSPTNLTVNASAAGLLDAFADFNADGDWNDAGEQIFTNLPLNAGNNIINYIIPANASSNPTFTRFRFSQAGGLSPTGFAMSGEVEDYAEEYVPAPGFKWIQPPEINLSGIHAHDGQVNGVNQRIVVADDWLCQGGDVTDIHWHGTYENQGSAIAFFHLSIHADDPLTCTPSEPEIWGVDVPLANANQSPSGIVNALGEMIYNYVYYLSTPFNQVPGTRYWLDISAVSVNAQSPALWKWCEAARSHLPVLCTAAQKATMPGMQGQWQHLDWSAGTHSDMAFEITSSISQEMDFGDAPDTYATLLASNGARHDIIVPNLWMGNVKDLENDGLPTILANGDDLNNLPDEDGVVFNTPLIQGQNATLTITANQANALIDGWIDYNGDGDFLDGGEQIIINALSVIGPNIFNFAIPNNALTDTTYLRFRISTVPNLPSFGYAPNGEVEDYMKVIEEAVYELEYGDAPDSYATLLDSDGARHGNLNPNIFMGMLRDLELNGQPSITAMGDDLNNLDDEDGVTFNTPLIQGQPATITIISSMDDAILDGWIDFNGDGDFLDAGEHIIKSVYSTLGENTFFILVPVEASIDSTYARFRISTFTDLPPFGFAPIGEVEDYVIDIEAPAPELDYGDAPEGSLAYPASGVMGAFPTCVGVNIASFISHNNFGAYFGPLVDFENEGNAGHCPLFNPNQYNQDECWLDNDAGLIIPGAYTIAGPVGSEMVVACPQSSPGPLGSTCTPVLWGQNIDINVTNQMPNQSVGYVNLLIDWNQDGQWGGSSVCNQTDITINVPEHVLVNFPIPSGYVGPLSALMPVNPPAFFWAGPNPGYVWGRFSVTEAPVAANWEGSGVFEDGETEDYLFLISQSTQPGIDWGDAPDPAYPTLAVSDGARHLILQGYKLGNLLDGEIDGQPHTLAQGDDMAGMDDEDGVTNNWGSVTGSPTNLTVNASAAGLLDAFADFNADGDWNDAGEQIFTNLPLNAGNNIINYIIPANASSNPTFTRFRFSQAGGLSPTGFAMSGEVEDYAEEYVPAPGFKWIQPPEINLSGIHAHDGQVNGVNQRLVVADDWLCQGGDVTDIHWHGTYENQGSAIAFFHLSIHADDPLTCTPSEPEIWGVDVPLANANQSPSGIVNALGEMIYNYVYYLSTPFNQVPGTRYWLDISAVSVNAQSPALWKWCEAARSHLPVLCTAAQKTTMPGMQGQWQHLDWSAGTHSDMAFEITSSISQEMDFGDAPDTYATLLASNGARHDIIVPNLWMGNIKDLENNGLPTILANGDDLNNLPDEDGVVFNTPLIQGQNATLTITANQANALIDGWIDYNGDGDFLDGGEQIIINALSVIGPNIFNFAIPNNALTDTTYLRFRISTVPNLPSFGYAPNGEVEDYMKVIEEPAPDLDFGDAPNSYGTLLASNGARHVTGGTLWMGAQLDSEADGLPGAGATGDDLDNIDDEDGVSFPWPLKKGNPAIALVNATTGGGFLNAWIDYNQDGDWNDANEHIFTDKILHSGNNILGFVIPANIPTGNTYARFRLSTSQGLGTAGMAPDGEVEDYQVEITTTATGIKWEQPFNAEYTGYHSHDYNQSGVLREENMADDWKCPGGLVTDIHWWGNYEVSNGVELRGSGIDHFVINIYSELAGCMVGSNPLASYTVPMANVNETGTGVTTPEGSMVYQYNYYLAEPFNQVMGSRYWISITAHAVTPNYPALWRWCESERTDIPFLCTSKTRSVIAGAPTPWTDVFTASDKSVNMAFVLTNIEPQPLDYGDAPDTYATLLASNGARHDNIIPTLFMGNLKDVELNGLPTVNADGDDLNNLADEDGVTFMTTLVHGQPATVSVVSTFQNAILNGWIDFNGDGDFFDQGEQIITNYQTNIGANQITFQVPVNAVADSTYCRFRISTVINLPSFGYAPNGEVEDYCVLLYDENVNYDWGDAPDPAYPTLFINNGARHVLSGLTLGNFIDAEANGQPDMNATGDDNAAIDDEDGVVFTTMLIPGQNASITVTASQGGGYLNAWIDYNGDGDWNDGGEHFITNQGLNAGANIIGFNVPNNATLGKTYLRFRLSTAVNLATTGAAPDGEVEDYTVFIVQPGESKMHWPQLPDLNPNGSGVDVDLAWTSSADDFLCTESGAINHIRLWGSFASDILPMLGPTGDTIQLIIHADIPAGGQAAYSRPGQVLWSRIYPPGTYTAKLINDSIPQWLYDPATQLWQPNSNDSTYRFDFPVTDDPFVQTQGTVYWLEIRYLHPDFWVDGTLCWKSTPLAMRWNDAAVWFNTNNFNFPIGWVPLNYPPTHPYQGQAMGLSFVIYNTPPLSELNGIVNYGSANPVPLPNTTVTLKQGMIILGTDITDANGRYQFPELQTGTYALNASSSIIWGGVNSADALLIMQHFVHSITLTGIHLKAGDVTGTSGVNSQDALMTARRFVHLLDYFPVGDWAFETPTVVIPYSGTFEKQILGVCYGDVNGTYGSSLKTEPSVGLSQKEFLQWDGKAQITIPVKMEEDISTAAISLVLDYSDKLNIRHVEFTDKNNGTLVYNASEGQLRISWFSLVTVDLKAGETIFTITIDASSWPSDAYFRITSESEFNDSQANTLDGVSLYVPYLVKTSTPGFFLAQNIPNPFSTSTQIVYSVPEQSTATLEVRTLLGKPVMKLIDSKAIESGLHTMTLDGTSLPQGVYYCTLYVTTPNTKHSQTIKISIIR